MARVGILGGTFNPPHIAHVVCAQEAHSQLRLDRVLLTPVSSPPHKELADDPGAARRGEMCELVAGEEDWLEVCRLELDRGGVSYTVETLRELTRQRPSDEHVLILGADVARGLPGWREPEVIVRLAQIAVAAREDQHEDDVRVALSALGSVRDQVVFFDMPRLDISSSSIRDRIASGRPIRHLVPSCVLEYIEREGLYRVGGLARR
jgi:nicotinate-nucleotide adenylyltransferase